VPSTLKASSGYLLQTKPKLYEPEKGKIENYESSSSIEIDEEELKEVLSIDSKEQPYVDIVDSSSSKPSDCVELNNESPEASLNLLMFGRKSKPPMFEKSSKEVEFSSNGLKIPGASSSSTSTKQGNIA
jgi:hypothetical protein